MRAPKSAISSAEPPRGGGNHPGPPAHDSPKSRLERRAVRANAALPATDRMWSATRSSGHSDHQNDPVRSWKSYRIRRCHISAGRRRMDSHRTPQRVSIFSDPACGAEAFGARGVAEAGRLAAAYRPSGEDDHGEIVSVAGSEPGIELPRKPGPSVRGKDDVRRFGRDHLLGVLGKGWMREVRLRPGEGRMLRAHPWRNVSSTYAH